MKICDIMTDQVVCIGQHEYVTTAAKQLKRSNLGALPVCDDKGRLRGMITDRDIVLRCVAMEADPHTTPVSAVMSRGIITAGPFDDVSKAVRLMATDQVRRLPVLDDGRLVGMVSLCDMARHGDCDMEAAEALSEISANFRRR